MKKIGHVLLFSICLILFFVTSFFTSWTASYLAFLDDWRQHVVFTPKSVADPEDIYWIDYLLYAYHIQPITTIVFTLVSVILLLQIGYGIRLLISKVRFRQKH